MAEPTSTYYVDQYLADHQRRYQTMYQLALQEVQADYTARVAQQELLMKELEKLRTYTSSLEKDLTAYIDDKGKDQGADADKELALMRMYVDIEKAKASQISAAQGRKLDAERLVNNKYDVSSGMQKALVDADTNIASRAALASSPDALVAMINNEIGNIVVSDPGSGGALSAAKELYGKTIDTVNRKGAGAMIAGRETEVRDFISDHFGLSNFTPPENTPTLSNPFNYNIPEMKEQEVTNLQKQTGTAATGGLSQAGKDVDKKLKEARGDQKAQVVSQGLTQLKSSEDYGMLLRSLSDDGQVSEDEWKLFTDRIEGQKPAAVAMYETLKKGARDFDVSKLPVEDQLIFDDQFIRKLGTLDTASTRMTEIQKEIAEPIAKPRLDQVTARARELYDPIRMTGTPSAQTFTLQDPVTGEKFTASAQDIMDMQQEFETVLDQNPDMAINFRAIEDAWSIAGSVKPPTSSTSKNSPEYIGYQLYTQFKANKEVYTPTEIASLAKELGGSQDRTQAIMKFFHAYNIAEEQANQPQRDKTGAANKFRDQLQEAQRLEQEALQNERGAVEQELEAIQKTFEEAKQTFRNVKSDEMTTREQRKEAKEAFTSAKSKYKTDYERTERMLENDRLLLERIAMSKPPEPVKPPEQILPPGAMGPKELEAEMNQPLSAQEQGGLPIGKEVKVKPGYSYGYVVTGYTDNDFMKPIFEGSGAIKGKTIKEAMYAEALAAYIKELEKYQAEQMQQTGE